MFRNPPLFVVSIIANKIGLGRAQKQISPALVQRHLACYGVRASFCFLPPSHVPLYLQHFANILPNKNNEESNLKGNKRRGKNVMVEFHSNGDLNDLHWRQARPSHFK